jgi:hypothetical protein
MKPEIGKIGDDGDRVRRDKPVPAGTVPQLEQLAWLLDSSIEVPGIRFRIGLDSLLGLIPFLGDIMGAAISTYILWVASKMGVPRVTLLRMTLNVALEAAVGVVPFLGDLFDMAWKANTRNVEILKAHLRDPSRARRSDWFFTIVLLLALLCLMALFYWAAFTLGRALLRLIRG